MKSKPLPIAYCRMQVFSNAHAHGASVSTQEQLFGAAATCEVGVTVSSIAVHCAVDAAGCHPICDKGSPAGDTMACHMREVK